MATRRKQAASVPPRLSPNQRNLDYLIESGCLSPQTELIGRHLLSHTRITPLVAWDTYRCRSITRRICDLEDRGVRVYRSWAKDAVGQLYRIYTVL